MISMFVSFAAWGISIYISQSSKQVSSLAPSVPLPPPRALASAPLPPLRELPPGAGGAKLIYPPPAAAQRHGRIFIDLTPEMLVGLLKKLTEDQAQRLLEPYINKWIALSGELYDLRVIGTLRRKRVMVALTSSDVVTSVAAMVIAHFDMKWKPMLDIIQRHGRLSVSCKIDEITRSWLSLTQCEIN